MNRKVAIVCVLLLTVVLPARAFDFGIGLSNGDSLFFSITDARAHYVAVVSPQMKGVNYWYGRRQPSGVLVIPEEVQHNGVSYKVTSIGERAFSGCTKIQLVSFPASLQEIGAFAFYGCSGIKARVTIGENVKSIGPSAFYGCSYLPEVNFRAVDCIFMGGSMSGTVFGNCQSLRKVIVDKGVRHIPDYAFCGVDAITDSVELPESLRTIGEYAFAYCSGLNGNLVIPDSVETIGDCAFHQCHALKSVSIGASVKKIGGRAFYHCLRLKSVRSKAFFPPDVVVTTFSDIPKTVKLSVPCVSKALYQKNDFWSKVGEMETFGSCTFTVGAVLGNVTAGMVTGSGEYAFGDTVTLTVICASGHGFIGWSDGNRENPRRFVATDNLLLKAVTRPTGIVTVVDTLYKVDTVYSKGYKVIHDTVDLVEEACSINGSNEVSFDTEKKRLHWSFPRREKVLSVSLYNQSGECIYFGDGRKGSVNMRRLPSGAYIVRIETISRVLRLRLFMKSEN